MFKRALAKAILVTVMSASLVINNTAVWADEENVGNEAGETDVQTDEDTEPANEEEQPTDEADQPSDNTDQPSDETDQPTDETDQPTDEAEQPTDESEEPTGEETDPTDEENPTEEPTPTDDTTPEPEPIDTPSPEETVAPTNTPTSTVTPKPTEVPATSTPTPTATPTPTETPTPLPYLTVVPPDSGEDYPAPDSKSDKSLSAKSPTVIKIDGIYDDAWDSIASYSIDNISWGTSGASGEFKVYWDKERLYVLVVVEDDTPDTESERFTRQDCVEIFFNESGEKPDTYGTGDSHYKVNRAGDVEYGNNGSEDIFKYAVIDTDGGYMVEASIEFTTINPIYGQKIGFDVRVNDSQGDQYRDFMIQWSDTSMYTYENLSKIGTLYLK
jgi:hypothetical protein